MQDILVTNEKGDDAPPNQSKMTTIFKYTLNTQDSALNDKKYSHRKKSILLNQN